MKYLLEGQETERLTFRLLNRNDFDSWLELFKEPTAGKFLGMEDIPTPEAQCEKWFTLCERRYEKNLGGMNVLIDKQTHLLIGQCGLLIQEVDGTDELEIGYSILPRYWNMGYATEAAQKCRDFAFEQAYADSLISITRTDNIKSQKVALKNGMKKEKQTLFRDLMVNIFRIDKQEWQKLKFS